MIYGVSNKRTRLINFKVNHDEYAKIEELAKSHADGNISVWLRHRGMSTLEAIEGELDDNHSDP
jgi:hypothetical protein